MNRFKTLNARRLSVAGFSFLFAYILSFQFEGQVLYSLLDLRNRRRPLHTGCNYRAFCRVASVACLSNRYGGRQHDVRRYGLMLSLHCPLLFPLPALWMGGLIVSGYNTLAAARWWLHGDFSAGPLLPRTSALNPVPTF